MKRLVILLAIFATSSSAQAPMLVVFGEDTFVETEHGTTRIVAGTAVELCTKDGFTLSYSQAAKAALLRRPCNRLFRSGFE